MNNRKKFGILIILILAVAIGALIFGDGLLSKGSLREVFPTESQVCSTLSKACEKEIIRDDNPGENCIRYESECLLEENSDEEAIDFGDEDFENPIGDDDLFE